MNRPYVNCSNCEHAMASEHNPPCSICVGFNHFEYRLIEPPISIHEATAIAKEFQTIKRQHEAIDRNWRGLEISLGILAGVAMVLLIVVNVVGAL